MPSMAVAEKAGFTDFTGVGFDAFTFDTQIFRSQQN